MATRPDERDLVLKSGERLADIRRAAGLSQEELADQLGITFQTLSNMERGYLARINYLRLREVARICYQTGRFLDSEKHLLNYMTMDPDVHSFRAEYVAKDKRSGPNGGGEGLDSARTRSDKGRSLTTTDSLVA